MLAKIEISGVIEVVTGLHIGGSSAFSAIGAVDSPVIKDIRTNQPMIPGSSLKGKMRSYWQNNTINMWQKNQMMMQTV
ncbi:RAMP superfamily CRISPR-associated protein [Roseburia sp. AM59-24XD]|uniref:RAMP superfamily CRISPR-associated protein n=1 Tax=Roseburia sp. AM59-24XD TaxID=2293138 RepID=UPI00268A4F1F|nr:RAMP superfamily CRISPR-associated protein [Roseburia sp. AM59-24XD]